MADYFGYFMQGLSEGLTSGVNLGLTYLEIKEKREQKKQLKEKETKLQEASIKWNTAITKAYEDGRVSETELSDVTTLFLGFSAEFQEAHQRAINNITKGYTDAFNQDMKFYDMWLKETEDLSRVGNISGLYEEYIPYFTTQKGKNLIEANARSKKRRAEAIPAIEVFPSATAAQEAYPDTEIIFNASAGGFVPKISAPPTGRAPTAIDQKIAGIENLPIPENQKLEMKIKVYGGGDSALEERIKKSYELGGTDEDAKKIVMGGGIDIHITPETVGTLATWEERFENITTEAEFNREQNLLTQSKDKFEPEYKTWKEHLVAEVEGMAKALKSYLDEKGNLKNEEWAASFKENVDTYMKKILEIQQKFPDVDLSKFPKFRGERKSILTIPYGGYIDEQGW